MSKPQSMNLALPDKAPDTTATKPMKVDENRTLTIILGENNKVQWYHGLLNNPIEGPKADTYGKNGIRKEVLKLVKSVPQLTGDPKKGLIVIIKPTKKSTYRNLVDILDEMAISGVETSAIVNDITPEEMKLFPPTP